MLDCVAAHEQQPTGPPFLFQLLLCTVTPFGRCGHSIRPPDDDLCMTDWISKRNDDDASHPSILSFPPYGDPVRGGGKKARDTKVLLGVI